MKKEVIIVAGGSGSRMNADLPKQFIIIGKKPILMHTLENFYHFDANLTLIVVLPQTQILFWNELCKKHNFTLPHKIAVGGLTRFESVKNGLLLTADNSLIAIQDGVRPFTSRDTIARCFETAEKKGNAIPVSDLVDSIREIKNKKNFIADRTRFVSVQTPQVFHGNIIKKAYQQSFSSIFTDDASVAETYGVEINLVEGNKENIKITTPFDLKIANALLEK